MLVSVINMPGLQTIKVGDSNCNGIEVLTNLGYRPIVNNRTKDNAGKSMFFYLQQTDKERFSEDASVHRSLITSDQL